MGDALTCVNPVGCLSVKVDEGVAADLHRVIV
jgi:hypothetical protein